MRYFASDIAFCLAVLLVVLVVLAILFGHFLPAGAFCTDGLDGVRGVGVPLLCARLFGSYCVVYRIISKYLVNYVCMCVFEMIMGLLDTCTCAL